jgi:hypothetical protein
MVTDMSKNIAVLDRLYRTTTTTMVMVLYDVVVCDVTVAVSSSL